MMKCCVMEPKWPNLKISSHLPARHGDILTVSCKPGYSLSGGSNSNVTCFDGTIQTEEQEKLPICLGKIKMSTQISNFVKVYKEHTKTKINDDTY